MVLAAATVSRETSEKLDHLEDLLKHWQKKINLVAPSSIADLRTRHVNDSLQLLDQLDAAPDHWVDLGSGGGFPGLPVAIVLGDLKAKTQITLIESDGRKCVFLREAVRILSLDVVVLHQRIEAAPPQNGSIVSARALKPLPELLDLVQRHLSKDGTALLPKGEAWQKEVEAARQIWHFDLTARPSRTSPASVVLNIRNLCRVED